MIVPGHRAVLAPSASAGVLRTGGRSAGPFLCSSANLPYSLHADADDYEDGGGVGAISGGSSKSLIACNFDSPYVSDDLLNNVHHYLTEDNLSLKEGISYQIVFAFNDIKYSLLISFT